MNSVSPSSSINGPVAVNPAARPATPPTPATGQPTRLTLAPIDRVDISPEARAAESSADRVARVRRQLQEGTYLHPDKLEIALDRMIDRLG